jgi:hypothetical protein
MPRSVKLTAKTEYGRERIAKYGDTFVVNGYHGDRNESRKGRNRSSALDPYFFQEWTVPHYYLSPANPVRGKPSGMGSFWVMAKNDPDFDIVS